MEFVDRKEVATVALLALGILLFANPAYTQGQGGSAASVQVGQQIQPDALGPQSVAQVSGGDIAVIPVVEYERLNNESRSIFDVGRQGVYPIRQESDADNAVLQSAILYGDGIYLRQTEQTQQGVELRYVNRSDDIESNIINTPFMSEEQRAAFENATGPGESVNLTPLNRGLSAYDYVYDNGTGTYYETSTESQRNTTVFSATETDAQTLVDPYFRSTDGMSDEAGEAVVGAIEGDQPVVTGDVLNDVQKSQLVKHEGAYYQLQFGQASPPITEALGPVNFAGMAMGLLFLVGGTYMARAVLREKS